MLLAARNAMLTCEARPVEVGYITSNGNVLVQLDWAFDSSEWLNAEHTIIASVSQSGGCWLLDSHMWSLPASEISQRQGFSFDCPNDARRNRVYFGNQSWWNYENSDSYSYNQFHTFIFKHGSSLRVFEKYNRDGAAVSMAASTLGGNNSTSNVDPTYNDRHVLLFGRYNHNNPDGLEFWGVNYWRFGGWKIKMDNQTIRDYVPATKGGELGVWDKVTGSFFTPQGTGTLTSGDR